MTKSMPSPQHVALRLLPVFALAGTLLGSAASAASEGETGADESVAPPPELAAPAAAARGAPPLPAAPRKPAIDDRDYAFARLDNGLDVLLISDPEADKAGAALSVAVGSFADPKKRQGLAHFLEHMLFLGTEKFPEADAYQQYIATHGGSHNAYTALDHTNYFFDIAPEQLHGALERFAQFFVAPLFNDAYVQREKKAVHSEYQLQLKDDGWRTYQVQKLTLNPAHPASKFTIGNLETLSNGDTPVREDLLEFYRRHYSSDQMALVVLGREDTGTLEKWARKLFGPVRQSDAESVEAEVPLFRDQDVPSLLRVQPIKEQRVLEVSFEVPPIADLYRYGPDDYLTNLLGHEGDGSLHAWLKEQGWIESLAAGSDRMGEHAALINVRAELTESGRKHWREIGAALFAYIERIRASGVAARQFAEQRDLARLAFNYREPSDPMSYVQELASNMLIYPAPDVIRGPMALDLYRPELIRDFLTRLRPQRAQVTLVAPDVETDSTERWFEVPYALGKLPEAVVERWQTPQTEADLHMPAPNPFIPDDLSLVEATPGGTPEQLIDRPGLELWHLADTEFRAPRADLRFDIRSEAVAGAPRNAALAALYVRLVLDELNAYAYPARLAGLSYQLAAQSDGISLTMSGFDDRQSVLLERILSTLVNLDIESERFERYKRELIREWRNSRKERPYTQMLAGLGRLLQAPAYTPEALVEAIQPVTKQDLKHWRQRFLASPTVLALLHGNLRAERARELASQVARALGLGADAGPVPQRKLVDLPDNAHVTRPIEIEHSDSSIAYYVQARSRDWEARARYAMLAHILRPAYFDSLRTDQQLGYVVAAFPWTRLNTPGIAFVVQSPVVSAGELTRRTRAFLQDYQARLDDMTPEAFEARKQGLLATLLQREKNLGQRTRRLWENLDNGVTTFDIRERVAAALRDTELETFRSFYADFLERAQQSRAIAFAPGRYEGESSAPKGEAVADPEAYKAEQTFYSLQAPVPGDPASETGSQPSPASDPAAEAGSGSDANAEGGRVSETGTNAGTEAGVATGAKADTGSPPKTAPDAETGLTAETGADAKAGDNARIGTGAEVERKDGSRAHSGSKP